MPTLVELGKAGMPLSYLDDVDDFAAMQNRASVWMIIWIVGLVLALLVTSFRVRISSK